MTTRLAATTRNARLDALITALGGGAQIRIFTTPRPANVAAAETGTLLAELTGGTPFAPAASGGAATANAVTQDASANATGTAAWARLRTSGGTAIMDIDVSATGGGSELELVTTSIVTGQPVQISSFVLTEGNA